MQDILDAHRCDRRLRQRILQCTQEVGKRSSLADVRDFLTEFSSLSVTSLPLPSDELTDCAEAKHIFQSIHGCLF